MKPVQVAWNSVLQKLQFSRDGGRKWFDVSSHLGSAKWLGPIEWDYTDWDSDLSAIPIALPEILEGSLLLRVGFGITNPILPDETELTLFGGTGIAGDTFGEAFGFIDKSGISLFPAVCDEFQIVSMDRVLSNVMGEVVWGNTGQIGQVRAVKTGIRRKTDPLGLWVQMTEPPTQGHGFVYVESVVTPKP